MNYYFWKWSNGETYYKSPLQIKVVEDRNNMINRVDNNYDSAQNAIQQSLYQEEFSNSDINISKREELDTKLSNRELVFQRGTNPFSTNSYVNDVITRDIYLKPINTTQGKMKEENNNN
jgi:hypothetical protein